VKKAAIVGLLKLANSSALLDHAPPVRRAGAAPRTSTRSGASPKRSLDEICRCSTTSSQRGRIRPPLKVRPYCVDGVGEQRCPWAVCAWSMKAEQLVIDAMADIGRVLRT